MKTKSILAALLLIVAGVQTVRAQKQSSAASGKAKVVLYKTNGQTIECEVSELDSIVFVEKQDIIDENHEWVDLGLPSGTLWATCNIGSSSLEEYGDYFAWGETAPKTTYDWGHYKYNQGSGKMTKYCTVENFGINGFTDGLTELLPEDDAATANWGSEWQMPSMAQLEELIDTTFTTAKWTVENGFNGTRITSKLNGNWIFLPASGYCESILLYREGSYGSCWTRSLRKDAPNSALDWGYNWSDIYSGFDRRYIGLNVRPVRVEGVQRVLATAIVLSDLTLNLLQGESKTITATVQPSDAYFPVVRWESSDEMVAKVDGAGLVTAIFPGTCTITCRAADGSGVYAECLVEVTEASPAFLTCPDDNHPHAIDLGLPSGTKWCCCNVGADMPESVGGYYAWGETSEKSRYDDVSYIFLNGQDTDGDGRIDQDGSYIDIGLDDIAGTNYDVAHVRMGESWCMPSKEQQDELRDNCSIRGVQQNGVNGILVTGPNGGRIFMPSTGYYWKDHFYDDGGYGGYWSSSRIHTELINVFSLVFNTKDGYGFWDWDASRCSYGRPVRPVRVKR